MPKLNCTVYIITGNSRVGSLKQANISLNKNCMVL